MTSNDQPVRDDLQGLGFALPVFCGLSWLPLVPRRRPVTTLVGAPLRPAAPMEPSDELLRLNPGGSPGGRVGERFGGP